MGQIKELIKALDETQLKNLVHYQRLARSVISPEIKDAPPHPSMIPHIKEFEDYFVHSPDIKQPFKIGDVGGIQEKMAFHRVHPNGHKQLYLIKKNSDTIANEGIMAKLFHAAGIGNLVHRTHVMKHTDSKGVEDHALVVHGANTPGMAVHEYNTAEYTHSPILAGHEFGLNLAKIGLMDILTGNSDRHEGNVLIQHPKNDQSKASPLAIDHDFLFLDDSFNPVTDEYVNRHLDTVYDWWHDVAKPAILNEIDNNPHWDRIEIHSFRPLGSSRFTTASIAEYLKKRGIKSVEDRIF